MQRWDICLERSQPVHQLRSGSIPGKRERIIVPQLSFWYFSTTRRRTEFAELSGLPWRHVWGCSGSIGLVSLRWLPLGNILGFDWCEFAGSMPRVRVGAVWIN
jgi:hypothetical protein